MEEKLIENLQGLKDFLGLPKAVSEEEVSKALCKRYSFLAAAYFYMVDNEPTSGLFTKKQIVFQGQTLYFNERAAKPRHNGFIRIDFQFDMAFPFTVFALDKAVADWEDKYNKVLALFKDEIEDYGRQSIHNPRGGDTGQ